MKRFILFLFIVAPTLLSAQGHKGEVEDCAPMVNGKVCYRDTVHVNDMEQKEIFKVINDWAQKNYGKDLFLSNVNPNKEKGIIRINSTVELLLNEQEKTLLKYKMKVSCHDNSYAVEINDITYQYDPNNNKKYKNYKAENVIANNGKSNMVSVIKDPTLFCNATYFFVENLFGDILDAVNGSD